MININISALSLAIGLAIGYACSNDAMAESMSKQQYKAHDKTIAAEYKTAKADCASLAENANDICMAEATGKKNLAQAGLEATYKPTVKNRYNVTSAKADAYYSVAIQKCDDKAGNDRDVCVKEAEAAKVKAIADAEVQLKIAQADAVANEKSTEAHKDAASDKRVANYAVAKEKCEVVAGDAKDLCIKGAKIHFVQ